MKTKFTVIVKNIILSLTSISVSLIALELILPFLNIRPIEESVYEIRRPVIQYQYGAFHPQLKYTLQKNLRGITQQYPGKLNYTVNTNSNGFRGKEWDLSPNRKNVLLLGDSFAFGWGVEWQQTAGQILEKKLQQVDPAYQVINLAQSGYSIKEIVNSYEYYRGKINPAAIIYIFCQNDLESYTSPDAAGNFAITYIPKTGAEHNFKKIIEQNQTDNWSWDKFRRGSYLHAFYARFVRPVISTRIRNSLRTDPPPEGFDFSPPIETPSEVNSNLHNFLSFCLDKVGTAKSQLYIIDTSDKADLYRKDTPSSKRWMLEKYAASRDSVRFINFENTMRLTPDSRKYFLDYDDHWSAEGHKKAATLLWKIIKVDISKTEDSSAATIDRDNSPSLPKRAHI